MHSQMNTLNLLSRNMKVSTVQLTRVRIQKSEGNLACGISDLKAFFSCQSSAFNQSGIFTIGFALLLSKPVHSCVSDGEAPMTFKLFLWPKALIHSHFLVTSLHLKPTNPNEIDVFYRAQKHISMCVHTMANPPSCLSAYNQCVSHVQIRSQNFSVQEFLCVGFPADTVSKPIVWLERDLNITHFPSKFQFSSNYWINVKNGHRVSFPGYGSERIYY